jgi:hypothetical protein
MAANAIGAANPTVAETQPANSNENPDVRSFT